MPKYTRRRRSTISAKQCAPLRGQHGTCFNLTELKHIAQRFNHNLQGRKHVGGSNDESTDASEVSHIDVHKYRNKMALWNEIDSRMQQTTDCSTELCWAEQDVATASYIHSAFRPSMPISWKQNHTEWLSTTDIQKVMQQYEHAHKDFYFVGAVPLDFASPHDDGQIGKCVVQELCKVRVERWWKRGIRKIGIVYNLDAHDEPGSHWVASYIDMDDCKVYYYDSFGISPPYEINKFLNNVSVQLERMQNKPCQVQTNHYRHQFKNTECGVYSMYFISTMLEGERSYVDFVENGLNDTQMNAFRSTFYNTLRDYGKSEQSAVRRSTDGMGTGMFGGGTHTSKKKKKKNRDRKTRRTPCNCRV